MKTYTYPADYDVKIINDVVVIYDLDQGNASVTNDIRNVLSSIHQNLTDLTKKKIIYRDSEKIFDGIKINENAKFSYFYPIREKELNQALIKINSDLG